MTPHHLAHTREHTDHTGEQTDRRTVAADLQAQLADQVAQLVDSEKWRAFLDFSRSFHTYSFSNVCLILSQHPSAEAVAGYRGWQAKGRQVRRGEKAIKIFGYTTKTVVTDDPDTGEQAERRVVRYPVLSVFALDQTDPIPGAEDTSTLTHQLVGEDAAGIYDRVAAQLVGQGWQVERRPIPGPVNGYTAVDGSRLVVIDETLAPAQAAKTVLHEAAHVCLHVDPATGHANTETADQHRVGHDGIAEIEAESVAYILAGLTGLDTADYSVGYLAGWADGDPDKIRATATRVLQTVDHLAPALTPAEEPDPEPAAAAAAGTAVEADASTAPDQQVRLADQPPTHHHRARQRVGGRSLPRQRLAIALAAAARGWHVFPLAPNRKTPVIRGWEQRATTDPERIERAWTPAGDNHGRWNIGIACGPSGLLVVDLDTARPSDDIPDAYEQTPIRTGADVLTDIQTSLDGADLPDTYTVTTPSGGRHLYYRQTDQPGEGLGNSTGRLGWLIDTRGHGGYVVAAGSAINGRPYRADDPDTDTAQLPGWLADRLTTPLQGERDVAVPAQEARRAAYLEATVRGEIRRVLTSAARTHNTTLFTASAALGRLVNTGHLDRATVRGALLAAGEAVGQPSREAAATIDSGLRNAGIQLTRTPSGDRSSADTTAPAAAGRAGDPDLGAAAGTADVDDDAHPDADAVDDPTRQIQQPTEPEHVDYPHEPGYLHDCPGCEAGCHCQPGQAECVYDGPHHTGDQPARDEDGQTSDTAVDQPDAPADDQLDDIPAADQPDTAADDGEQERSATGPGGSSSTPSVAGPTLEQADAGRADNPPRRADPDARSGGTDAATQLQTPEVDRLGEAVARARAAEASLAGRQADARTRQAAAASPTAPARVSYNAVGGHNELGLGW